MCGTFGSWKSELKIKCLHGLVEPCLSVLSESYLLHFCHLRWYPFAWSHLLAVGTAAFEDHGSMKECMLHRSWQQWWFLLQTEPTAAEVNLNIRPCPVKDHLQYHIPLNKSQNGQSWFTVIWNEALVLVLEGIPGFVMDLVELCVNVICINLCFPNAEKRMGKQSVPAELHLLEEKSQRQ